MDDELIRKAPEEAKARPATGEVDTPDAAAPFGAWLVAISRPGADLSEPLKLLRSAPLRRGID